MDEGGIPPFVIGDGDGDGLEVISVVDIFKFIMKWFTKLTSSYNVFQRGFLRNLPVGVGDGALKGDPDGIVGFDLVGGICGFDIIIRIIFPTCNIDQIRL